MRHSDSQALAMVRRSRSKGAKEPRTVIRSHSFTHDTVLAKVLKQDLNSGRACRLVTRLRLQESQRIKSGRTCSAKRLGPQRPEETQTRFGQSSTVFHTPASRALEGYLFIFVLGMACLSLRHFRRHRHITVNTAMGTQTIASQDHPESDHLKEQSTCGQQQTVTVIASGSDSIIDNMKDLPVKEIFKLYSGQKTEGDKVLRCLLHRTSSDSLHLGRLPRK